MTEIAPKKYIFDSIDELLENVKQGWLYEEFKDIFDEEDLKDMEREDILRSIASFIINEGIVIDEKYLAEKTPSIIEECNITDEELYEWFYNPNPKKNEENNDEYLTLKNSPLYDKFVTEIDKTAPNDEKEYQKWLETNPYSDEKFKEWLKENYSEEELKKEIEKIKNQNNTKEEGIRRKF